MFDKKILVNPDQSIFQALEILQAISTKCLIVVDKNIKLLGTINDGDIRRAILKGLNLETPISKVYKKKSFYIYETDKINQNEIFKRIKNEISIIPVVDKKKKVINFLSDNKKNQFKNKIKFKNLGLVIMAGGLGTRLKPYSNILPKPLLPFKNKTILENVINSFLEYGFKKFIISINYKNILIKSFFKELNPKYKISFIEEKTPLGTAGALRKLYTKKNKTFIVTNCDTILDLDYNELCKYHFKNNNDLSIVISTRINKIPYGVCYVDKNKLTKIVEKPEKYYLANVGVYLVSSSILNLIDLNKNTSFVDLINKLLKKKKKIGIFPITEKSWKDLGQSTEFIDNK